MDLEKKILGEVEEKKAEPKTKANWLADNTIWEVTRKGCGKTIFNGLMVREMLDANTKTVVLDGKKEVEYNGFKFKLVK